MTSAAESEHHDFRTERAFLQHAARCLAKMRDRAAAAPNAGADKKAAVAFERLRELQLERMWDPNGIVFGRLKFEEGDDFHLGPQGIWGPEGNVIVVNWAADAAKPYYEATPDDPAELVLRRRLRTERETLLGIADEWFGTADVEPTIGDILLDELGRDRTAEMRQIAATIQRDQYRIIERPLDSPTVVQGGPGTGKTVVGLHRAALLLYRHRAELTARRVLVIGPNQVFMRYIAYVLPSLGETAADQVAVGSLVDVRAVERDDKRVALVKGDVRMAEVVRRAVVDRVRAPTEDTEFTEHGVTFSVSAERIAALIGTYDPAGNAYADARLRFRSALRRVVDEAYRTAFESQQPGRVPTVLPTNLPELDRALDRIWPSITPIELVRQLLASVERIERAGEGVLDDAGRRLLYRKPVERVDDVRWSESDLPLIDEAQALMQPSAQRYGHVILDEAQDLTPMQLRMVGRRISGGSVTVLGDLAQATGLWSYETWEEVIEHLGVPDAEVVELTHAYRVPREIMELALPVLELTAPSISPPVPFRDGGFDPQFSEVSRESRASGAVSHAQSAHEAGGTAAIIAPRRLTDDLRAELVARGLSFGDAEQDELATTIELLDPTASKGLEFDHVIVVEPTAIIRDAEGQEHRELYVALTRATRTLTCVHAEPLQWPLGEREIGKRPSTSAPHDAEPRVVDSGDGRPGTPPISVGEALVLARLRGMSLSEALARALVATEEGLSEDRVAAAVLDETVVDGARAAIVVQSARAVGSERDSHS